ncbi:MAG: translocation/assembly module TamB domain-containing protein, partial [Paracoccaceae bacterium]
LALALDSTSLRIGISQADRLLSGPARLTGAARRDETGTTLRALDLTAKSLTMSASGKLATVGSNLTGQVTLGTLTDLDPAYGGGLSADLRFEGTPQNGTLTLTGNGHSLSIGQTEVDRLIAGQTTLDLALTLRDGALLLQNGQLDGPNLTAEARGNGDLGELQVTGRIRDLALLAPGYPGPVTLSGRVTPGTDRTALDLRILGPAAIDASIKGQLVGTTADLTLRGTADAAVLNALADPATLAGTLSMDLALRGPFSPTSLSGRVTLSGGRLAYPYRGVSLTRTELLADLANGRVQLSATSELTNGGRLRLGGTVGMAPPFDAALDLTLDQIHLRDPELFDTTGSGQLRITGPLLARALLAGRILFGETSLQVPATGFASAADLEAITHVGDTAAVRTTRTRAGLDGNGTSGPAGERATGPDWALNVTIDAPNRIFLRGRGLDAELGGQITLGGTLQAVIPTGAIQLIRGRLDLLGKRLTLSKADLALEGDLVPTLSISASNETDGVTTYLNIDGPANAPEVTFSSTPELPQEEVLAYLLFGRGLETISVLQAAELANAVAVLAGRGGEGIVAKLRRSIGVDDLDINTAADGTASVGA